MYFQKWKLCKCGNNSSFGVLQIFHHKFILNDSIDKSMRYVDNRNQYQHQWWSKLKIIRSIISFSSCFWINQFIVEENQYIKIVQNCEKEKIETLNQMEVTNMITNKINTLADKIYKSYIWIKYYRYVNKCTNGFNNNNNNKTREKNKCGV